MANTDLPNAKIIILFILSKVDSIPSAKLTDCALESLYVDYFSFSQAKKSAVTISGESLCMIILIASTSLAVFCSILSPLNSALHPLTP